MPAIEYDLDDLTVKLDLRLPRFPDCTEPRFEHMSLRDSVACVLRDLVPFNVSFERQAHSGDGPPPAPAPQVPATGPVSETALTRYAGPAPRIEHSTALPAAVTITRDAMREFLQRLFTGGPANRNALFRAHPIQAMLLSHAATHSLRCRLALPPTDPPPPRTAEAPSPLLDLPTEIIELIAGDLSLGDLNRLLAAGPEPYAKLAHWHAAAVNLRRAVDQLAIQAAPSNLTLPGCSVKPKPALLSPDQLASALSTALPDPLVNEVLDGRQLHEALILGLNKEALAPQVLSTLQAVFDSPALGPAGRCRLVTALSSTLSTRDLIEMGVDVQRGAVDLLVGQLSRLAGPHLARAIEAMAVPSDLRPHPFAYVEPDSKHRVTAALHQHYDDPTMSQHGRDGVCVALVHMHISQAGFVPGGQTLRYLSTLLPHVPSEPRELKAGLVARLVQKECLLPAGEVLKMVTDELAGMPVDLRGPALKQLAAHVPHFDLELGEEDSTLESFLRAQLQDPELPADQPAAIVAALGATMLNAWNVSLQDPAAAFRPWLGRLEQDQQVDALVLMAHGLSHRVWTVGTEGFIDLLREEMPHLDSRQQCRIAAALPPDGQSVRPYAWDRVKDFRDALRPTLPPDELRRADEEADAVRAARS